MLAISGNGALRITGACKRWLVVSKRFRGALHDCVVLAFFEKLVI